MQYTSLGFTTFGAAGNFRHLLRLSSRHFFLETAQVLGFGFGFRFGFGFGCFPIFCCLAANAFLYGEEVTTTDASALRLRLRIDEHLGIGESSSIIAVTSDSVRALGGSNAF